MDDLLKLNGGYLHANFKEIIRQKRKFDDTNGKNIRGNDSRICYMVHLRYVSFTIQEADMCIRNNIICSMQRFHMDKTEKG